MNENYMLAAIAIPLLGGILQNALPDISEKLRKAIITATVFSASVLVFMLILNGGIGETVLLNFGEGLDILLRFDKLGRFFAIILAFLWPLTTIYAFSYMEEPGKSYPKSFFMFFMFSYATALGVSMSGNMVTLYFFYEMLTLSTMPLVLFYMDSASISAAKIYLAFSIGGASFGLMAIMYLFAHGVPIDFASGGIQSFTGSRDICLLFYVVGFFGFSVKAAIFPFHSWLPKASVAPTPVTALLHAVAVVKAGVFAATRFTYYVFGAEFLDGSWSQNVLISIASFTVVFGSVMALKEQHFKRRLAYSTVSNLSYILLGAAMESALGLHAALMHMIFHAVIKILAFFCCGAVMHKAKVNYVYELNGMGKRMPVTFTCFTISALALTGIPPFAGFISKWELLTASITHGGIFGYIGAAALLISALITAIYMFSCCVRAFFMKGEHDGEYCEADARMTVPMIILAVLSLAMGVYAEPIVKLADTVVAAIF